MIELRPEELAKIYKRRFEKNIDFRNRMYKVLCRRFFQRYVPEDSVVLDIATGYCSFINNIKARRKIALDLNPDTEKHAASDVEVIHSSSTDIKGIGDATVDVVYISNFLEHLCKEDIVRTLKEVHRVMKRGGRLLIMQPNIRYCYRDYWIFFDHITPLDDKSVSEALSINGFAVLECRPRFLPYSLETGLPKSILLLKVYLSLPFLHSIFGGQFFMYAIKK